MTAATNDAPFVRKLESIRWEDNHAVMDTEDGKVAFMSARDDGNDVVLCSDEFRSKGVYTIEDPCFTGDHVENKMLEASDLDLDNLDSWRP